MKFSGKMIVSIIIDQWISFIDQYELTIVEITKSKISVVTNNKQSKRGMIFVRIGTKSTSSYTKATTHFNLRVLPPLIKMYWLSYNFLNPISVDNLETIYCSEDKNEHDWEIERFRMRNNSTSICFKSSSTPPDNPPVLQSKYSILDSHNINTASFKINLWVLNI